MSERTTIVNHISLGRGRMIQSRPGMIQIDLEWPTGHPPVWVYPENAPVVEIHIEPLSPFSIHNVQKMQ